jgi:hypothetical protein
MIRTGLIASLLFSLAAACAASPQAGPDPRWTPQQQEIIALLENGPMGIETDFEAWENEFHDDWTVWFAGQPDAHAKGPHMARVRDYIGRGARVVSYEAEFADIAIVGLTALARFNAVETLQEPDGTPRIVHYASTDFLIRVDGEWKIRATTISYTDEPDGDRN